MGLILDPLRKGRGGEEEGENAFLTNEMTAFAFFISFSDIASLFFFFFFFF